MAKIFTLMRMISHPEPPRYIGDPNDIDLSPKQMDGLVRYQISLPNPQLLTAGSFFVAGLTDQRSTSEKIYKALLKASIIFSPSDNNSSAPVNTAAISKDFTRQLPFIIEYTRRKLVAMLFFWEEQCTCWKSLDEEGAEILSVMGRGDVDSQGLDQALQAVQIKKRLLPGQVRK